MIRLALTYGAVSSTGAAAWVGWGQGQAQIAAALVVAALALLGLRVASDRSLWSGVDGRRLARRAGTFAVVGLVISTAALGGVGGQYAATGTASAEWVDCSFSDPLLGGAYNTLIGADSGCRWEAGDVTDWENVTATDGYSSSLSLKDSANSYTATTSNFMEDTRTVAYSKGKIALVNALNNGSSLSVAENEMNQSVEDYYSRVQKQAIADWNAKATQVTYTVDTGVTVEAHGENNSDYFPVTNQTQNATFTLVNGTTVDYYRLGWDDGSVSEDQTFGPLHGGTSNIYNLEVYTTDPSDSSRTQVLDPTDYRSLWNGPADQATQVKNNLDPYADEVYNQYAAGELDSTDLARMDPSVIGNEATTSLNSTGYYGHAAIMLASLGAGGDINVSHTVNTSDGTSLDGTIYYTGDDAPADGWETGTTYNHTDYNGTVYMAVQKDDGNATIVDLGNYGSEFTIAEATNTQTGESVNTTTVHRYTYDSTNASNLENEIQRLRDLRESYESQQSGGGGGIGIDFGGMSTGVIVALLAVVFLLTRD